MFADTSVALQAETTIPPTTTPKKLKPKSRKELKSVVDEHIENSADDEDAVEKSVCKRRKHETPKKKKKKSKESKKEVRLDRLACTKN